MITWDEAKKTNYGFNHIRIRLVGKKDSAVCIICGESTPLQDGDKSKKQIVAKMAREHFYKHKLDLVND